MTSTAFTTSTTPTVNVRHARPGEARTARRLAALDSAPALRGEVLLALVGDEPVAAMSLLDGRVVADPFVPTLAAVEQLRRHAPALQSDRRGDRRGRRLRPPRIRFAT